MGAAKALTRDPVPSTEKPKPKLALVRTAALVQKAKAEKYYRGDLSWKLHSAQKVINRAFDAIQGQLFVANCSRQFGKSYWAVTKAIEFCLQHPKAQVRYGAAFHSDLKEFIRPAFDKILDDCPKDIKPVYRSSGSYYIFPNGSRIRLVGIDKNPNGLRGNTLDLIIIDEAGFVSNLEYIYTSVIIPATTHRPNAKIIIISTPPVSPDHAFVEFAQKAELENAYCVFTIYDNPMLGPADYARLMKESGGEESTTWKREYLAMFVVDADKALVGEWNDSFLQDPPKDKYYDVYHKYVAMDLGTKHFTALVFGYYDFLRATLYIEDEFMINGPSLNTIKLVAAVNEKEKELWGEKQPFRRISDNNNLHLLQDLTSIHGLNFAPTNKESLEAMLNELKIMVQQGRVIISPKCKMLRGCLKFGIWDKNRVKFAESKVYGHYDLLAALVYLVRNLAKGTNPIPADFGAENHTHWLGNIKEQMQTTANARELKKAFMTKIQKPEENLNKRVRQYGQHRAS